MEQYEGDALKGSASRRTWIFSCRSTSSATISSPRRTILLPAHGIGEPDDIDHPATCRVRAPGELLQNQFRIGFSRMERVIRERMTLQGQDMESLYTAFSHQYPSGRCSDQGVLRFFSAVPVHGSDEPAGRADPQAPSLRSGPGGLSRDRACFEVRDVHYTHYGRMCPIESRKVRTSVDLYLATFARINHYGFIEAPYRKIDKATGKVTDEVVYMTADGRRVHRCAWQTKS